MSVLQDIFLWDCPLWMNSVSDCNFLILTDMGLSVEIPNIFAMPEDRADDRYNAISGYRAITHKKYL
jgi:hypothetical protein